jgi:hypothetical protein
MVNDGRGFLLPSEASVRACFYLLAATSPAHRRGLGRRRLCLAIGRSSRGSRWYYDATRTPFRIAQNACWNNEPRAAGGA